MPSQTDPTTGKTPRAEGERERRRIVLIYELQREKHGKGYVICMQPLFKFKNFFKASDTYMVIKYMY